MALRKGAMEDLVLAPYLKEALRGRSVFVTGHTGFKGSWLCLWLHALGARVSGFGMPAPTQPSNFGASGVREILANHEEGDVRDAVALTRAIKQAAPDVVLHLAAQPLVRESYARPRDTFEVNVIGTAGVLDAVRTLARPCVTIVATSDKCYENREQEAGYRENDPMGGSDPYSASKGAAELLVASYRRSFFAPPKLSEHGVQLASVRAGNVIGGGDWAKDRIVTDLVSHLSAGKDVPLRNPNAIRPWQHVLEPLSGYLFLVARMLKEPHARWCTGWNFGPYTGEEARVGELVELFCRAWGAGQGRDVSTPGQLHEAGILRLNIDNAATVLGWKPRWNLETTVQRTAAWYQRYHRDRQASMRSACLEDLAAYGGI